MSTESTLVKIGQISSLGQEAGWGFILGLSTGFVTKKVSKVIGWGTGLSFLGYQGAVRQGWVQQGWIQQNLFSPISLKKKMVECCDLDGDGEITLKDAEIATGFKIGWVGLGSFAGGAMIGFWLS